MATVPLVLEVAVDASCTLHLLEESLLSSENVRRPDKEKKIASDEGEKAVPKRAMEDEDNTEDSRRAKRSQVTPSPETREATPSLRGATQIPFMLSMGELVPAILEKLRFLFAIDVASVHKYWTSAGAKATDNADLWELLKLAEMSTSRSHILNCELYKMLGMKIDELRSTVVGAQDIEELRSENKILYSRLAIFEDARAHAKFKIIKSKTIQRLSVSAQKQAELKLKVYEYMAYTKHKQLAEALAKLAKAKELLAKLGASNYADPKGSMEAYEP
ncbi:hypothetical protein Fot_24677 [Forsythia ovata]|uniref:Uncharacterized protein n=1 Tax=Forsythia ovata TaxID=205694 RepID=A0ABD1U6V5_9LAMI